MKQVHLGWLQVQVAKHRHAVGTILRAACDEGRVRGVRALWAGLEGKLLGVQQGVHQADLLKLLGCCNRSTGWLTAWAVMETELERLMACFIVLDRPL